MGTEGSENGAEKREERKKRWTGLEDWLREADGVLEEARAGVEESKKVLRDGAWSGAEDWF